MMETNANVSWFLCFFVDGMPVQVDVTTGTRIFVNSENRNNYPINYVYGFASEGFSYFLTTQMTESRSAYISKLVRVCHNDSDYYSYTEVNIDPANSH